MDSSTNAPSVAPNRNHLFENCNIKFNADFADQDDWAFNANSWLEAMEDNVAHSNDIETDEAKLKYFKGNLGSSPRAICDARIKSGRITDFESFYQWFTEKYVYTHSPGVIMQKLHRVTQSNTVSSYLDEFLKVLNSANGRLEKSEVHSCFFHGFQNSTFAQAIRSQVTHEMEIDEIADLAIRELFLHSYNLYGFRTNNSSPVVNRGRGRYARKNFRGRGNGNQRGRGRDYQNSNGARENKQSHINPNPVYPGRPISQQNYVWFEVNFRERKKERIMTRH